MCVLMVTFIKSVCSELPTSERIFFTRDRTQFKAMSCSEA
jgi:hypothetical protein